MKKTIVIMLIAAMAVSFGMTGCGEKNTAEKNLPTAAIEAKAETMELQSSIPDIEPETDAEKPKDVIVTNYSLPEPNYNYQVWNSDDIILGEVIEELESKYSNPDNTIDELANMWITPYVIRVEKSYKDLIKDGDTVVVNVWNELSPEDKEKEKESNVIRISNYPNFNLNIGQKGVFFLTYDDYLLTDENEKTFDILYQNSGIFEEKNVGVNKIGKDS